MPSGFTVRPLTPDTWVDLEELVGLPGGSIVRGCWCMFYRRTGKHSGALDGTENKSQLRRLVDEGTVPGLVGYLGGSPVGWISLGPRGEYLKLQRSPIMKPVDDADVWSIVCTYVAKSHRGEGLQHRLLDAAVRYARDNGVRLLEAYPVDKPHVDRAGNVGSSGRKCPVERAQMSGRAGARVRRPGTGLGKGQRVVESVSSGTSCSGSSWSECPCS